MIRLEISGDSLSLGPDHPDHHNLLDKQWPALLAQELGIRDVVCRSVPGDQAADQSCAAQFEPHDPTGIAAVFVGANDVRVYGNCAAKRGYFKAFLLRLIADYVIPTRVRGRASAMLRDGEWYGTPVNPHGITTTSAHAVARATVSGSAVYIGYIIQDYANTDAVADVLIDGAVVGAISPDGTKGATTGNGRSFAPALARFSTTPGLHDVEVRVRTSDRIFYLDDIRGNDGNHGPSVYVANLPRWTDSAYSTFGVSEATLLDYNRVIAETVETLAEDGLPVSLVDTYSVVQPEIHMSRDGLHPNLAGHQEIKAAFQTAIAAGRRTLMYPTAWNTSLLLAFENGVIHKVEELPLTPPVT